MTKKVYKLVCRCLGCMQEMKLTTSGLVYGKSDTYITSFDCKNCHIEADVFSKCDILTPSSIAFLDNNLKKLSYTICEQDWRPKEVIPIKLKVNGKYRYYSYLAMAEIKEKEAHNE